MVWHLSENAVEKYTKLTHWGLQKNGCHYAEDIFKCFYLTENYHNLIQISLKHIPKGPVVNKSSLIWVMAWHRTGNKPLFEPMMSQLTDAYMRHPALMR